MKNDPVQLALERLDDERADLAKALASKYALVVAKAARLIGDGDRGDRSRRDLTDHLSTAFTRLLRAEAAADKGCVAKLAIVRALTKLDHDDAELYLAGMKHIQREPVWGGSEDTAAELRGICALGLAGSTCHAKLRELVPLMVDPEWPARCGAVRAIAVIGSEAAGLLLRLKALTGDPEHDVMVDTLAGVLAIEGPDAVPLALTLAGEHDAAILALGTSRLAPAIDALKSLFARTANPETKATILLALASARTEPAIEFLVELVRTAPHATVAAALRALAIHRADPKLREIAASAVDSRADRTIDAVYSREFGG